MDGAEAIAKGLSSGGLEFIIGVLVIALIGMFWLLMRQRDRFEQMQEKSKNEVISVYKQSIKASEASVRTLESIQEALERMGTLVRQPHDLAAQNRERTPPPIEVRARIEKE